MKKPFLKVEIKRKIIEPEEDLEKVCIVPEMGVQYIKNAVITVHEDGYAFITWLQPVKDWKYHVADALGGCLAVAAFLGICAFFWSIGINFFVVKLQSLGVI